VHLKSNRRRRETLFRTTKKKKKKIIVKFFPQTQNTKRRFLPLPCALIIKRNQAKKGLFKREYYSYQRRTRATKKSSRAAKQHQRSFSRS
jgi:hypothetical protein